MRTGFLYSSAFLEHDTGISHPERRERLIAAMSHLNKQPWFARLKLIEPRLAQRKWLREVHEEGYLDRAEQACHTGQYYLDVADVRISSASYRTALQAAGGTLELADRIIDLS